MRRADRTSWRSIARVRVAELVGTLSIVTDLSAGTPVERFMNVAARVCSGLEHRSPWSVAMDAEPSPQRAAEREDVEEALLAMANVADLKSRFAQGHSTGVSALCASAARQLGFGEDQERSLHGRA